MCDRKELLRDADVELRAEQTTVRLVSEWPVSFQVDWYRVLSGRSRRARADLAPFQSSAVDFAKNTAYAVSRFARFFGDGMDASLSLPNRLGLETLLLFTDELAETCDEATVYDYLDLIIRFSTRCDPEWSAAPCRRLLKQFDSRKRRSNNKRTQLNAFSCFRIADARLAVLETSIEKKKPLGAFRRDPEMEEYRNVLIVAWLCLFPVRLRNIVEVALGESLKPTLSAFRTAFTGDQMKNGHPLAVRLPNQLTQRLRFYIDWVRPHLAEAVDPRRGRLWLTHFGHGFSPIGMHEVIRRVTALLLNESMSAHQFRYMLADTATMAGVRLHDIAAALQHCQPSSATEGYVAVRNMSALDIHRLAFAAKMRQRVNPGLRTRENLMVSVQ